MIVKVTMIEVEIRNAIAEYISNHYGVSVSPKDLDFRVKSKQNYKSEWETADIRVDASCTALDR